MIGTFAKWVVLPVLLIAVAMALFGKKTFHVEIFIPAPPSAVWSVLTDAERYEDWNPVFVKVEGTYRIGEEINNLVRQPDGSEVEIAAVVAGLIPNRELRQTGGVPGILTFDHKWSLEPVEDGTKVVQHEVDRGFWLWFWESDWIVPAYTQVSEALKGRVALLHNSDL